MNVSKNIPVADNVWDHKNYSENKQENLDEKTIDYVNLYL